MFHHNEIHTIWHSLLWHISLVKKHGWLERHGNPSCATHPLKMAKFHSHVQFPEGIPPKTNSHFSEIFIHLKNPKSSSFFGLRFALRFSRFHTKRILSMSQEMFRNVGLGHGILQFAHIPRSLKVFRNRYHQKMTFSNSLFHFWYVRFSFNSLYLVTIWATYLLIT